MLRKMVFQGLLAAAIIAGAAAAYQAASGQAFAQEHGVGEHDDD